MRIEPAQPPYGELIDNSLRRLMPAGLAPLALFRVLARDERLSSRFELPLESWAARSPQPEADPDS